MLTSDSHDAVVGPEPLAALGLVRYALLEWSSSFHAVVEWLRQRTLDCIDLAHVMQLVHASQALWRALQRSTACARAIIPAGRHHSRKLAMACRHGGL